MRTSIRWQPSRFRRPSANSRSPTETRRCAFRLSATTPIRISGKRKEYRTTTPCNSQVTKRLSHGLQIGGALYTWSHALDEQSGLGLFFNGNDPLQPHSSYSSSDFDRTHVISINYVYQFPKAEVGHAVDGLCREWLEHLRRHDSRERPTVHGLRFLGIRRRASFFSADDFVTNPVLPLAPGVVAEASAEAGNHGSRRVEAVLQSGGLHHPAALAGCIWSSALRPDSAASWKWSRDDGLRYV